MAEAEDLYATLGVAKSASDADVRRAYRRLARKHHPDVNPGNRDAEERFKQISAAYQVLSDPGKRKLYDEFGAAGLREGFDPAQARAYQQWTSDRRTTGHPFSREQFDFDLGDFNLGDVFGGSWGRGFGRRAARGDDLLAVADLDFVDAIRGTEVAVPLPGRQAGASGGGTGESTVRVRVPPGTEDGARLVVRGRGAEGPRGAPPGDLIIETRVRPHPYFRRDGLDLHVRLPLTVEEAFNGAQIAVPTPQGPISLRIPPRSQPGAQLRVRGRGLTRNGQRGDLIVTLDVRLPDQASADVADAVRRLGNAYSAPVREGLRL